MERHSTHRFPSLCRLIRWLMEQPVSPCPGCGMWPPLHPCCQMLGASLPVTVGVCVTPCFLQPCGSIADTWGHSPAPEEEGRRGPPVEWAGCRCRGHALLQCFLQGSPFPFVRCGRTEQTLTWSWSQICYETTQILPLSPGLGLPRLPQSPWS